MGGRSAPGGVRLFANGSDEIFLSAEFGIKAAYAEAIAIIGTHAAYSRRKMIRMQMVVTGWSGCRGPASPGDQDILARLDSIHTLVAAPRYDEFRDAVRQLAASGDSVRISEIAGNREIFLTGVAPSAWEYDHRAGRTVYALPLPTDSTKKRVAIRVPVGDLLTVLARLDAARQLTVDHIYDY